MRYILRLLGFPVLTFEREVDAGDIYVANLGGQFDLAGDEVEYEEDYEYSPDDPEGFGFR